LPVWVAREVAVEALSTRKRFVDAKISAAVLLAFIQAAAWLGLLWLNGTQVHNAGWVLGLALTAAGITSSGAALSAALLRDRERAQFVYSLGLLAAVAVSTLAGFSPLQTIARLAIGDPYTNGWSVAGFAAVLVALWLLLQRLSRRLAI